MSTQRIGADNHELDDLFERYRTSPDGHVFAPLADACRKAGMLDEALEICARGVSLHPRYASGWVVRGKCLFDAGREADAEAAFGRVLDIDRNNLVALKYLGVIHASRGELARARDHFEQILAIDPDNRDIRAMLEEVIDAPQVCAADLAGVAPADGQDPGELDDEAFEGEPITLRDESVTPDEIATMTLADIYAAQGYLTKALKIYRELYQRQPGAALLAKIDELEARVATPVPVPADGPAAEARAADEASEEPVLRPVSAAANVQPPAAAGPAPAPVGEPLQGARTGGEGPRAGAPMDTARNYEQFKRWLKTMSG